MYCKTRKFGGRKVDEFDKWGCICQHKAHWINTSEANYGVCENIIGSAYQGA